MIRRQSRLCFYIWAFFPAKYSRNGGSGGSASSYHGKPVQSSNANNLDSISDNSATDLLDDDCVDFQDYKKRMGDFNVNPRPNAANSKGAPASIFDDI